MLAPAECRYRRVLAGAEAECGSWHRKLERVYFMNNASTYTQGIPVCKSLLPDGDGTAEPGVKLVILTMSQTTVSFKTIRNGPLRVRIGLVGISHFMHVSYIHPLA